MRIIQFILGSTSDLPQCRKGFLYLKAKADAGIVRVRGIRISSIHRNTVATLFYLVWMCILSWFGRVHILIIGAGMANHLTGTSEAFLRYFLRSKKLVVIGIAFSGKTEEATLAAELSISQVPNNQIFFKRFVGEDGVNRACVCAVNEIFPKIKLPPKKPTANLTFERSLELAQK
jgi:hypothetical protein